MKYELTEKDLELINQLLDVALRAGGLQNKPAVDYLIDKFSKPIEEKSTDMGDKK